MTPTDIAALASRLTRAQRAMVLASEPGGWGNPNEATGADVMGSSGWATALALERRGMGDIEESPGSYPPALYFHNSTGLAVRHHLLASQDQAS